MDASSSTTLTKGMTRGGDSYLLGGRVFHASYGCPTWVPEASELGCSATAWLIDTGAVRGVDVSNLLVVSVGWRAEEASSATSRLVALVDERATPEQVRALVDVFQGRLGGPLSRFALLDGTWAGVYQVPINLTSDGGVTTFSVPNRLGMAIALPGPGLPAGYSPRRDAGVSIDWALGWVGRGVAVSVTMPEESWAFEAQDCQAFFAWFATRSVPAPDQAPPGPSHWPEDRIWAASAAASSWWPSRPSLWNC
jgi:hypothetical protein